LHKRLRKLKDIPSGGFKGVNNNRCPIEIRVFLFFVAEEDTSIIVWRRSTNGLKFREHPFGIPLDGATLL
jgi:hypothetical protein